MAHPIARRPDVGETTLWDEVLARVEGKVNRHSFATWFRPTSFTELDGLTLRVRVPNPQFKDWLARNYQGVISEALQELGRADVRVSFECAPECAAAEGGADREASRAGRPHPK